MDERQELNAGRAAMIVLAVLMIGCVAVLGWEYLRTQEVTNTAAIVVMLGAGGLFVLIQRMFGAEAPRTFLGQELPTGSSAAEKAGRRRAYAVDAGLFAVAMTGLTFGGILLGDATDLLPIEGPLGLALLAALELVGGFAIFYAFNWVLGESAARGVEKKLSRLEA